MNRNVAIRFPAAQSAAGSYLDKVHGIKSEIAETEMECTMTKTRISRSLVATGAVLLSLGFLSGCGVPKELTAADQAIAAARQAGKDKDCPELFATAERLKNEAFAVCTPCDTAKAIGLANEALARANALCPPKPVPPPPPPPPVVKAPEPAPAPAPAPPPPPPPPVVTPKVIDRLTLHVNFATNKATFAKADDADVEKAVEFLKKYPTAKFDLEGHTDSTGSDAYNQTLSEKRAEAVKERLVKRGIDPARIHTVGFGEKKPIADNKTAKGRAENRRVEVLILSE
jgi:outer membrane protein OmpA-like peptidoglycan-associated protein